MSSDKRARLTLFQPRVCSTRSPPCTDCEIPSNQLVQPLPVPFATEPSYLEDYKVGTSGWPKQTSPLNQYSVQGKLEVAVSPRLRPFQVFFTTSSWDPWSDKAVSDIAETTSDIWCIPSSRQMDELEVNDG